MFANNQAGLVIRVGCGNQIREGQTSIFHRKTGKAEVRIILLQ
jgi:hypothetical protein